MNLNYDLEIEFNKIVADILKNEEFLKLRDEYHHGFTRIEHSINVAKVSFKWAKVLKVKDYVDITRAALVHDFFTKEELHGKNQLIHPGIANRNAIRCFGINKRQSNMILSHMFPLCTTLPTNVGSWIITAADKYCATYECSKYKVPTTTVSVMVFLVNFLSIRL